jgi:hypothetical protein
VLSCQAASLSSQEFLAADHNPWLTDTKSTRPADVARQRRVHSDKPCLSRPRLWRDIRALGPHQPLGLSQVLRSGGRQGCRLQRGADIEGDDVNAGLGKREGMRATLPACGAGDRRPPSPPVHSFNLSYQVEFASRMGRHHPVVVSPGTCGSGIHPRQVDSRSLGVWGDSCGPRDCTDTHHHHDILLALHRASRVRYLFAQPASTEMHTPVM